jgi:predicted nucleic acid-binding protein
VILADSTVWIDHLRHGDPLLTSRLNTGLIAIHPFIIGEIALGSLRQRDNVLALLRGLPMVTQASDDEVQALIEQVPLYSRGIGYVDAHLLAATRLTAGLRLWTHDRRLHEIAHHFSVAETRQH